MYLQMNENIQRKESAKGENTNKQIHENLFDVCVPWKIPAQTEINKKNGAVNTNRRKIKMSENRKCCVPFQVVVSVATEL